jgi:hypothetical protein
LACLVSSGKKTDPPDAIEEKVSGKGEHRVAFRITASQRPGSTKGLAAPPTRSRVGQDQVHAGVKGAKIIGLSQANGYASRWARECSTRHIHIGAKCDVAVPAGITHALL